MSDAPNTAYDPSDPKNEYPKWVENDKGEKRIVKDRTEEIEYTGKDPKTKAKKGQEAWTK